MQIGRRCQLHGVVSPQAVDLRQPFGVGQQSGRDFQDGVLVGGIVAELGQEGRRDGGGYGAATASAGDGGDDLDPSDAGQKNLVGGGRIGQALDPPAADFRR